MKPTPPTIRQAIRAAFASMTTAEADLTGVYLEPTRPHTRIELRNALSGERSIIARVPHHACITAAAEALAAISEARKEAHERERKQRKPSVLEQPGNRKSA
jgi:hypothetical protein